MSDQGIQGDPMLDQDMQVFLCQTKALCFCWQHDIALHHYQPIVVLAA